MKKTYPLEEIKKIKTIENFKDNFFYELSKNYYSHEKHTPLSFEEALVLQIERIEDSKKIYKENKWIKKYRGKTPVGVGGIPEYAYFLTTQYLSLIKEVKKFSEVILLSSEFFSLEKRAREALKNTVEYNYDKELQQAKLQFNKVLQYTTFYCKFPQNIEFGKEFNLEEKIKK